MSKKIIIAILFLIILALAGWFLISQKTDPQGDGEENATSERGFLGNIFPFGDGGNRAVDEDRGPSPTGNTSGGPLSSGDVGGGLTLQQLSQIGIAGYTASTSSNGVEFVRFVEQTTGNVYDVELETQNEARVTNTTIPRIYEALWRPNGEQVILRYVSEKNDVVKSYLATVTDESSSTTKEFMSLEGDFLPDNIENVVIGQSENIVLITVPDKLGINTFLLDLYEEVFIPSFDSDFGEWNIVLLDDNTAIATTRASHAARGFVYEVDIASGVFRKILGGQTGLTALPNHNASKIFFSTNDGVRVRSYIHDNETRVTTELNVQTFAEKCVWGSGSRNDKLYCGVPTSNLSGKYPDRWYQGISSFSDSLFEIDASFGTSILLTSPTSLIGRRIDVIDMSLSNESDLLFFRNKRDSSLWSLELAPIIEEVEEEATEEEEETTS